MYHAEKLLDLPSLRIVMLLTDAHGGFGGISKFNRDFLSGLDAHSLVERVHVLPRIGTPLLQERLPESITYDWVAAKGKLSFLKSVWTQLLRADRINLVICGHIHLLPAAWLLARIHGVRLALIIHGIEAWKPSARKIANPFVSKVDSVISVSQLSATRFISWSGLSSDKVFVLPNCVDLNRFKPEPRDSILAKRYGMESSDVIMTMGRLESKERHKGFDEVIAVMPRLLTRFPNLKYLIVGDGPDRVRLENLANSVGVSQHVIFAGKIPEAEKVAHYNLAHAYVMPSIGEGFGIVLIEAAACGLPVIGSRIDGSQEALLGGRLGRLIDPTDIDGLIQPISETLMNPTRARNPLISHFDEPTFRARVASWLEGQAIAIAASDGSKRNTALA
jgi:glycosyltransferase involved in cell wall biosynthesis